MVRTPDSHSDNMGSIPIGAAIKIIILYIAYQCFFSYTFCAVERYVKKVVYWFNFFTDNGNFFIAACDAYKS